MCLEKRVFGNLKIGVEDRDRLINEFEVVLRVGVIEPVCVIELLRDKLRRDFSDLSIRGCICFIFLMIHLDDEDFALGVDDLLDFGDCLISK